MAESKIRDDNYFLVSGWMINRLNLRGVALQIFSIIYGFSQDGEGSFTGSLQYLCDFTNSSKNTVIKALKELVDKSYITKTESTVNGVRFCTYKTAPVVQKLHRGSAETEPGGSAISAPGGSAETAPNNKVFDNKDNINKDIVKEIIDLYHSICVSFPSIRAVSEARRKAILSRLKKYSIDDFKTVFENAEASSFLKGADGWKASFDWLIKEDNMLKVLEGNYADRGRKEKVPKWCGANGGLGDAELANIQRLLNEDKPTAGSDPDLAARAEDLKQRLGG